MYISCVYILGSRCNKKRPFFIIYNNGKNNKLWVSDIFVRELDKLLFSYNLWWLKLTIDRHTYASKDELLKYIAKIWSSPELPDKFFDIFVEKVCEDKGNYIKLDGEYYELYMGFYVDRLFYERFVNAIKKRFGEKLCYTDSLDIPRDVYDMITQNGYKILYIRRLVYITKFIEPIQRVIDSIVSNIQYTQVSCDIFPYYVGVGLSFISYILYEFCDSDTYVRVYTFNKDNIECYAQKYNVLLSYRYLHSINRMIELFLYAYPESQSAKKETRVYESELGFMAKCIANIYDRPSILTIRRNIYTMCNGKRRAFDTIEELIYLACRDIWFYEEQIYKRIAGYEIKNTIKNENILLTVYELVFTDVTGELYMIYDLTDMVNINNEYVLSKTISEVKQIIEKEINRILRKIKHDYESGVLYNYGDKHSEFIFLYPRIEGNEANGYAIKHVNIKSL